MKFNLSAYTLSSEEFGSLNSKIHYSPELSSQVTFAPNRNIPRHRWFYYKESFSDNLVKYLLQLFKNKQKKKLIFDPFCGVGTTLLASKSLNYDSFGLDILPFCTFLANVKTHNYSNLPKITQLLKSIKGKPKNLPKILDRYYLNKAYDKKNLEILFKIKQEINEIQDIEAQNLAKTALLSILLETSKARRDGGFLRFNKDKVAEEVLPKFHNKIEIILNDLVQTNLQYDNNAISEAKIGDARTYQLENKFSSVITSPPYLNRYDYTRNYALELTFDFVDDNELKLLRYNTIKSHVESKSHYKKAPSEILHIGLERLKTSELSNPQIPEMVFGYFADMYAVLENLIKYSKDEAKIAFVLSTSRFSGIHFEADLILKELGEDVGLTLDSIIITKLRGSSAQQCKVYGDRPHRESIVIFKK